MKEIVGSILNTITPWILPAILVGSWLVNHKTSNTTDGKAAKPKKSAEAKPKGETVSETPQPESAPVSTVTTDESTPQ